MSYSDRIRREREAIYYVGAADGKYYGHNIDPETGHFVKPVTFAHGYCADSFSREFYMYGTADLVVKKYGPQICHICKRSVLVPEHMSDVGRSGGEAERSAKKQKRQDPGKDESAGIKTKS